MANDLWINLPVRDLERSIAFYDAIGFVRQPGPGNTPTSACFLVSDRRIVLMLFLEAAFARFTGATVSDTDRGTEVLLSIGVARREEVDALATQAVHGGGTVYASPGGAGAGMYGCGLRDPDGHRWNVLHMGETGPASPAA